MKSEDGAVAMLPTPSFTAIVNAYVPAEVGVPLSVPERTSSVIPGGSDPDATENV